MYSGPLSPNHRPRVLSVLEEDIERYTQVRVRPGDWHSSEALQKSREEHQQMLPDGPATKNHHVALALYERTGFEIMGITMTKNLTR